MATARARTACAAVGIAIVFAATAAAASARTLYVTGSQAGKVSAFTIGSGGSLSGVSGSPYNSAGAAGTAIAPDGKHLFVANSSAGNVSAFTVEAGGGLTAVNGSPFAAGMGPRGVSVSPDGKHLYVTNSGSDNVSAYAIGSGGDLTAVSGSPFGAGDGALGVAMAPDGSHLYVANQLAATISVYAVAADGSLSAAGSAVPTPAGPAGLAVTPNGSNLYSASSFGGPLTPTGQIAGFSIGDDGSLAALSGSPFAAGNGASGLAITPDARHLYATNDVGNQVAAYSIAADGGLTAVSGSPFASAAHSRGIAITPDEQHLYASGDNGNILFPAGSVSAFSIGSGGELSGVSGSPFGSGFTGTVEFGGVTTTPDQAPVASFTAVGAKPGMPSAFDASASSDPDGSILRYDWNFGDGVSLPNGGATPTHPFPGLAAYTVTLLVTDNEGCNLFVIYTGQTAACNGGLTSIAQRVVDLDPPKITLGGQRVQRLRPEIIVKVSSDEAGKAVGKGKLTVRSTSGGRSRSDTIGNVRSLRLKPVSVPLAQAQTPTALTFKLTSKIRALANAALEDGGKVTANLHVSAFDAAGNEDSQLILVQLHQ